MTDAEYESENLDKSTAKAGLVAAGMTATFGIGLLTGYCSERPGSVHYIDVDGDDKKDIVVESENFFGTDQHPEVFIQENNGSYTPLTEYQAKENAEYKSQLRKKMEDFRQEQAEERQAIDSVVAEITGSEDIPSDVIPRF